MKTTIEIEDPLLEQAKALATKEGVPLRRIVGEGIRAVLRSRGQRSGDAFQLKDVSFDGGGGLRPGVGWQDFRSLAYEDKAGRRRGSR